MLQTTTTTSRSRYGTDMAQGGEFCEQHQQSQLQNQQQQQRQIRMTRRRRRPQDSEVGLKSAVLDAAAADWCPTHPTTTRQPGNKNCEYFEDDLINENDVDPGVASHMSMSCGGTAGSSSFVTSSSASCLEGVFVRRCQEFMMRHHPSEHQQDDEDKKDDDGVMSQFLYYDDNSDCGAPPTTLKRQRRRRRLVLLPLHERPSSSAVDASSTAVDESTDNSNQQWQQHDDDGKNRVLSQMKRQIVCGGPRRQQQQQQNVASSASSASFDVKNLSNDDFVLAKYHLSSPCRTTIRRNGVGAVPPHKNATPSSSSEKRHIYEKQDNKQMIPSSPPFNVDDDDDDGGFLAQDGDCILDEDLNALITMRQGRDVVSEQEEILRQIQMSHQAGCVDSDGGEHLGRHNKDGRDEDRQLMEEMMAMFGEDLDDVAAAAAQQEEILRQIQQQNQQQRQDDGRLHRSEGPTGPEESSSSSMEDANHYVLLKQRASRASGDPTRRWGTATPVSGNGNAKTDEKEKDRLNHKLRYKYDNNRKTESRLTGGRGVGIRDESCDSSGNNTDAAADVLDPFLEDGNYKIMSRDRVREAYENGNAHIVVCVGCNKKLLVTDEMLMIFCPRCGTLASSDLLGVSNSQHDAYGNKPMQEEEEQHHEHHVGNIVSNGFSSSSFGGDGGAVRAGRRNSPTYQMLTSISRKEYYARRGRNERTSGAPNDHEN